MKTLHKQKTPPHSNVKAIADINSHFSIIINNALKLN